MARNEQINYKPDGIRAYIAGEGLEAVVKGKKPETVAVAADELGRKVPNAGPVLLTSFAEDMGQVGDKAFAEMTAEERRQING